MAGLNHAEKQLSVSQTFHSYWKKMNNSSEEGKVIASQSIESMQHKLARTELNFGFQTAKRSFYAALSSAQPLRVILNPSCLITGF